LGQPPGGAASSDIRARISVFSIGEAQKPQ
jgi:hypothetical protein